MERKHMTGKRKTFMKPQKGPKNDEKYKKFIGNRSEGQGFADKRKRKIKYEYMKMLKKEKQKEGRLHQTLAKDKLERDTDTQSKYPVKARKAFQTNQSTVSSSGHLHMLDTDIKGPAVSHAEELGTKNKRPDSRKNAEQGVKRDLDSVRQSAGKSRDKQHKHFRKDDHVKQKGVNRFTKAAEEHRQKKEMKLLKTQEFLQRKKQNDEAMSSYQKRKQENFKKICKKTHKGQPVMKNQIEYLLQKIEKQVNQR